MADMEKEILKIMADHFGLVDLESETPIFSAKLLDSMDVLRLIMELERAFEVKIPVFEVSIEMFDTVASVAELVIRLK